MDRTDEKAALAEAAEEFLAAAKAVDLGDHMARGRLMKQVDNLRYLSEDAFGSMMRHCENVHAKAALRILTDMGVFKQMPRQGSIASKELADAMKIDESVIQRAMRMAIVQGIGEETSPNHYAHNAKSLAYCSGASEYFFEMVIDQDEALMSLPHYLDTHTKEDLYDWKKSPYACVKNMEGKTYYEVISADAGRFRMFNNTLVHMEEQLPVLGAYPFSSLKAQVEAEPQRPFIVDVGGGIGRVLHSILQEAPNGFGAKVILQDRPDVIDAVPAEYRKVITPMVHDFFTPQPVKNAHIYLLRRILHDFYEQISVEIVKNIASAMGPTSRLLVGDCVIPTKATAGDDGTVYWLDLTMMTISGQEKTEEQFSQIFDAAGLELVKIWRFPMGAQAIVEAKLKS